MYFLPSRKSGPPKSAVMRPNSPELLRCSAWNWDLPIHVTTVNPGPTTEFFSKADKIRHLASWTAGSWIHRLWLRVASMLTRKRGSTCRS